MSDTQTIEDAAGTITVTAGVLSRIVRTAAESVDGARAPRPKRGLDVEVDGDRARVGLELVVRHGEVLPDVAGEVQRRVHAALRTMCGLETTAIDVDVQGLDP